MYDLYRDGSLEGRSVRLPAGAAQLRASGNFDSCFQCTFQPRASHTYISHPPFNFSMGLTLHNYVVNRRFFLYVSSGSP